MLVSGWKSVSMVDVHGKVTFTLWLCGCNLKCPFCHNWKIAEKIECRELNRDKFFEDLKESRFLIDYLHITGGEPLLQWNELESLLEDVKKLGVNVSLNTNATLVKPLEKAINRDLIDHIATDLKVPPSSLYGLSKEISEKLWNIFLKSLSLISDHQIPLELRIPVGKGFPMYIVLRYIEDALKHLERHEDFYIILTPLVGPPLVSPRDKSWCLAHCFPQNELDVIGEYLKNMGINPKRKDKTLLE
ncbi:anaerobic ribonucleoside-triphosphate reductase activating protein [Thermococcus sp. MV5]|uniref:anaerobic ribonucleoside-triphosphate reductase activating protein n=1 Tax=Thermococcus sp. MV5 TaxID=1638272 RepID=UPI0014389A4C|nr:anaerobic ribonucleoside-triphosphate reductase activating protein [Thermococcus sp. MV5]NJE26498.1 anaerobic ribonucleoside-triphosphate reductase activating protein [Thermococcus sp. MV5]